MLWPEHRPLAWPPAASRRRPRSSPRRPHLPKAAASLIVDRLDGSETLAASKYRVANRHRVLLCYNFPPISFNKSIFFNLIIVVFSAKLQGYDLGFQIGFLEYRPSCKWEAKTASDRDPYVHLRLSFVLTWVFDYNVSKQASGGR